MTDPSPEHESNSTVDESLAAVLERVGESVSPTADEKQAIDAATTALSERIRSAIEERTPLNPSAVDIVPTGSTARGTFLAGDSDIDLFVRFPTWIESDQLESFGLTVGEQTVPDSRKNFADHPYITGTFDGFEVDVVPCFAVEEASALQSPVDRTPFHTEYLSEALDGGLRREVRIAKRFLKASGVYGADAKTEGFSGFLTELLILEYGGFNELLHAASDWGPEETIDIEDHATETFTTPLVVIDPVDPGRNAAAAVSHESIATLVHSARQLLGDPSDEAFEEKPVEPIGEEPVEAFFRRRDTHPVALEFEVPEIEDETLYPQLEKSLNGLLELFDQFDFTPIRSTILTAADRSKAAFLFEFTNGHLPAIERRVGPPVHRRKACQGFMNAYADDNAVVGPFIDGDSLIVERERNVQAPETLLETSTILDARHGAQIERPLATTSTIHVGPENVARLTTVSGMEEKLHSYIENPSAGIQSA